MTNMLRRLYLDRSPSEGPRTFSTLSYRGERICYTLVPTDKMMADGFYHMTLHGWHPNTKLKRKRTYAMNGLDVSAQPDDDPETEHDAVLFHAGNWIRDSKACELTGLSIGVLDGERAVVSSEPAMERLRTFVGKNEWYLIIRSPENGK